MANKSNEEAKGPVPGIDFATFVLSLSTTGFYQMGLVADPETGERAEPNLVLAQQTIETLQMLRAKTRGNLDAEEENLF